MAGRVSFVGLPAVELGRDIDWALDPHRNRSWALNLHALRWMGGLVAAFERSGDRGYLDRAAEITADWVRKNPRRAAASPWAWAEHPIALRAPALVRLSAHVSAGWLSATLAEHGRILADPARYRNGHNHGLDQDIALLAIGGRLRRRAWAELAVRRMTASATAAIDAQGALHEQAPKYGGYVHARLGVALEAIERCGLAAPAVLVERRRLLENYVSHATQPNGRLVPIGDTPADAVPRGFRHEPATVGVFQAGYVFGRTAWDDPRSAYYSIRFGPGRAMHGHEDHLGVTYHAQGRDLLVEAGFHSYEATPYPAWTRSPEAHNVPVVEGAAFRPGTATRLAHVSVTPHRQEYRLSDEAYGVERRRRVVVGHGAEVLAVFDEVPPGSRVRTIWHLGPSLRVTEVRDGRVVLACGEWRAALVQLALPSGTPLTGQTVTDEVIATGYLKTTTTPTVLSPPAESMLTILVPGTPNPEISTHNGKIIVCTPGGPVDLT